MRLIDADKFKEDLLKLWDYNTVDGITATTVLKQVISDLDNAPTVELDESVIQEVLSKRCMTAVTNEYLIALHGKRPQGEWVFRQGVTCGGYYKCNRCGEVERAEKNYCSNCGADMRGDKE